MTTKTCERCKNIVPLSKIKLRAKGTDSAWLICDECALELKHNSKANIESKFPKSQKKKADDEKEDYLCTRCRYHFRIDPYKVGNYVNLKCPYCGRSDRLEKI
jgi:DNA-directed RNA polymerase subunit RPC12/RpoP